MKKHYECLIILNDVLTDEEKNQTEKKITQIFQKFSIKVLQKVNWGRRKLGYPIKKAYQGFFLVFYIESETSKIADLRVQFGYEANILKNILFSVEDWKEEADYLNKLQENPLLNLEKLSKE